MPRKQPYLRRWFIEKLKTVSGREKIDMLRMLRRIANTPQYKKGRPIRKVIYRALKTIRWKRLTADTSIRF